MEINKDLIQRLFVQAVVNPRLRQNLDLRTLAEDNSQRMLNALMPSAEVPIHRYPMRLKEEHQISHWYGMTIRKYGRYLTSICFTNAQCPNRRS